MSELIQIGGTPGTSAAECAVPVFEQTDARIVRLQIITLVWMFVECGVALFSARRAHSPALLAFGSDSIVELLSAAVVLLAVVPSFPLSRKTVPRVSRKTATRAAGILLFVLAAVVALASAGGLILHNRPETSLAGIAITIAALVAMPVLAASKRSLARETNNRALAADAVQSATCAYLAGVTLAGLAVNAVFHLGWVDSAAALIAVPILIVEGRRALKGESCGCC